MAPPAVIALLLVVFLVLVVPIIAILTDHQQKMARLMREGGSTDEIRGLREEIRELKALIHQQVIASDTTKGRLSDRLRA